MSATPMNLPDGMQKGCETLFNFRIIYSERSLVTSISALRSDLGFTRGCDDSLFDELGGNLPPV